jgi:hypothetical protein
MSELLSLCSLVGCVVPCVAFVPSAAPRFLRVPAAGRLAVLPRARPQCRSGIARGGGRFREAAAAAAADRKLECVLTRIAALCGAGCS